MFKKSKIPKKNFSPNSKIPIKKIPPRNYNISIHSSREKTTPRTSIRSFTAKHNNHRGRESTVTERGAKGARSLFVEVAPGGGCPGPGRRNQRYVRPANQSR